ncbi:MAG: ABC transporter permease subunit [Sulfolobales archaeon]
MLDLLISLLLSMTRMFVAYLFSLIFSFLIGVSIARNRVLEALLLPVLDVLQSIPILGFFPLALVLLINTLPGFLGVELAIVFLISTSMIWNMIFGVYASIKSLDPGINDLIRTYRFSFATRFFRVYVPSSTRSVAANSIISWAGGWFFITSSEIITLGSSEYRVKGIGTYIMTAYETGDLFKMYIGITALIFVIIGTYVLLWNPLFEESGFLKLISIDFVYRYLKKAISRIYDAIASVLEVINIKVDMRLSNVTSRFYRRASYYLSKRVTLILIMSIALVSIFYLISRDLSSRLSSVARVQTLSLDNLVSLNINTLISLSRVVAVLILDLLISLYLAYIAFNSMRYGREYLKYILLAGEVLGSIPAILWWPILSSLALSGVIGCYIVALIVFLQGSLWYTFYNILLYGVSSVKRELIDLADIYRIKGVYFLRNIFIPSLLPSIATGALSAWGGAWNSTIVAEYFSTDHVKIDLRGIGAMITRYALENNIRDLTVAVIYLSLVIILINRVVWREIFKRVSRRFSVE